MEKKLFAGKVTGFAVSFVLAASLLPAAALATLSSPQPALAASAPALYVTRAATGKVTLAKGAKYTLSTKATSGSKVTYSTSKKSVATVNSKGTVTAKKNGTAVIYVRAKKSGKTTTRKVTVSVTAKSKLKPVKKVYAKAVKSTLYVGSATKMITSFNPKSPSNRNVTFKSSNTKVAGVDYYGKVTAKKPGVAYITVVSAESSKRYARVKVTVKSRHVPRPTPPVDPKPEQDEVQVKSCLEDYSWTELKAVANRIAACSSEEQALSVAKSYNLLAADGVLTGKEVKNVTLSNGTTHPVRILGFWHDEKTDGSKAGITFEFTDSPFAMEVSPGSTKDSVWTGSGLNEWLTGIFAGMLPSDLRQGIVPVKKLTGMGRYGNGVTESAASLWLLSISEVYGPNFFEPQHNQQGKKYKLYKDHGVVPARHIKITQKSGASDSWWLRSPDLGRCYLYVHSDGGWDYYPPDYVKGVSPGFCL